MKKGKILSLILATVGVFAATMSFVACGTTPEPDKKPDNNPSAHSHTYATEWSKDDTNHWHAATCEHTTETKDSAAHTFNDTACTVCGYPAPVVVVKCKCETECQLCPECGGCIQTDCANEECIKCGDGLVSHKFEAVEAKLSKGKQNDNGSYWKLNPYVHTSECTAHKAETATSNSEIANADKFVSGIIGSSGGAVTYEITSNKKTTATLRIMATSYDGVLKATAGLKIIVNDELVESEAELNIVPSGYNRKTYFYYVTIGCIELEEGTNTLVFMGMSDPRAGCNIAHIDVMTTADVTLGFTPQAMPEPDEDGNIADENTKWIICDEKA